MLGETSKYSHICLGEAFVGVDFDVLEDLSPYLKESTMQDKTSLKQVILRYAPNKTPIGLGLAAGAILLQSAETLSLK